jgi:hypothetical protein
MLHNYTYIAKLLSMAFIYVVNCGVGDLLANNYTDGGTSNYSKTTLSHRLLSNHKSQTDRQVWD